MVYYKFLFGNMEMLTIRDKIIYSALIDYSIKLSDLFYEDGRLNMDDLKNCVELYAIRGDYGSIKLITPTILEMSHELNIPRSTLYDTIAKFKDIRLIEKDRIRCHKNLFDQGFLSFPSNLKIRGQLLVFYVLLEYRSRPYDGIIDTYAKRLSELLGVGEDKIGAIYDMLYKLHKQGFVQRLPHNKLKVISFEEAPKREEASQPSP